MRKILYIILIIGIISCRSKKENNSHPCMYKDSTVITSILKEQLRFGFAAEKYETDYPNYKYNQTDFEATIEIIDDILKRNNYKSPDDFNDHICNIFKINKIATPFHHVILENRCVEGKQYEFQDYWSNSHNNLYIVPAQKMIVGLYRIPELIDYQKYFPVLANIEDSLMLLPIDSEVKIFYWKNTPDLSKMRDYNVQSIVHRNKFLFNDCKESFVWLMDNDLFFLEQLVRVFGYDKDPDLNNVILNKAYTDYASKQPNDIVLLQSLFAKKDCEGDLQIREGLMKHILNSTTKEDNRYLKMMEDYGYAIANRKLEYKELYEGFDNKDRLKTEAYVGYYVELTRKNNEITGNEPNWNPGSLLRNEFVGNQNLLEEIQKNNYYNLPDFENMVNEILYQITEEQAYYDRTH